MSDDNDSASLKTYKEQSGGDGGGTPPAEKRQNIVVHAASTSRKATQQLVAFRLIQTWSMPRWDNFLPGWDKIIQLESHYKIT